MMRPKGSWGILLADSARVGFVPHDQFWPMTTKETLVVNYDLQLDYELMSMRR